MIYNLIRIGYYLKLLLQPLVVLWYLSYSSTPPDKPGFPLGSIFDTSQDEINELSKPKSKGKGKGKRLAKVTVVSKLFLTLRSVPTNAPDLTMKDVADILLTYVPKKSIILVVKEFHKSGEHHYHAIVNRTYTSEKGVSKNLYQKEIRALFPTFTSKQMDITGAKSPVAVMNYCIKTLGTPVIIAYSQDRSLHPDRLYSTHSIIDTLRGTKSLKDYATMLSMVSHSDKEAHQMESLSHSLIWAQNPKKIEHLWDMSNKASYVEITLGDINNIERMRVEEFLSLKEQYNVTYDRLTFLRKILYFVLNRSKHFPIKTKQKNLLV